MNSRSDTIGMIPSFKNLSLFSAKEISSVSIVGIITFILF